MKIVIKESQYQRIFGEDAEKKIFRPFQDARDFVRTLNLKSVEDWRQYSMSGERPNDIPANPNTVYPNEFKGYGDWLGSGTISSIEKRRNYWPFEDAREYVRELKLKSSDEWKEYAKSPNRPIEIPAQPHQVYPEFQGYSDWIGKYMVVPYGKMKQKTKIINPIFLPYKEARNFVRTLNLKGQKEWIEYVQSGNKPKNIPSNPRQVYGDKFKGVSDWLGIEGYTSFEEARNYARSLRITSADQYKELFKEKKIPKNIPGRPDILYKASGWNGWKDYLKGPVMDIKKKSSYLPIPNETSDEIKIKSLEDKLASLEALLRDKGLLDEGV